MKNLLNPKWIFLINTLPIIILGFLCYGEYSIIKSILNEDNITFWKIGSLSLFALALFNIVSAIYLIARNKNISLAFGFANLLLTIAFLYWYFFNMENIMPRTSMWMVSDVFVYAGTFLMPTIACSFATIIYYFTPNYKNYKNWDNFLLAALIPIFWYLLLQFILPFWKFSHTNSNTHVLIILAIIMALLFLFFLLRGIYILVRKRAEKWNKYSLLWKIPIAIIFPILGLLLNNGNIYVGILNVFGDFSDPWYYILACINGIFICLPNKDNLKYRLFLFVGRSICFAYTTYFFFTFLPYLPFAIFAIIAVGLGFLMLAPLILFVIHVASLAEDFKYIRNYYSGKYLTLISVACFLVLPFIITANYLNHKSILNEALAYIDKPNYTSTDEKLDTKRIMKTLSEVEKNSVKYFNSPYLSSYFKWLVLGNLQLDQSKEQKLKQVFVGGDFRLFRNKRILPNENILITDVNVESKYNKEKDFWESWVNLEMTNSSTTSWPQEYQTSFNLPTGCWINNYYLDIEDRREMGILSERKSALWVYQNIVNENRDPGILYYNNNEIVFRVFPFSGKEVRTTGIQFIHKNPEKIYIDGFEVLLGDLSSEEIYETVETENAIYVPAEKKESLKKVQRKPYFHFIVDASSNSKEGLESQKNRIKILETKYHELFDSAKISFTNAYVQTYPLTDDWNIPKKLEGGFFLERAIEKILYNEYNNRTNRFPVIICLSDNIESAAIDGFSKLQFTYPELTSYFEATVDGELIAYPLFNRDEFNTLFTLLGTYGIDFKPTVLEYVHNNTTWYLPDDKQASIILKNEIIYLDETKIEKNSWETALNLEAKWMSQNLHPELPDKEWISHIKSSFTSGVMTPVTSYVALENDAQKAALMRKKNSIMANNSSLGGESTRMSEPNIFILGIILLGLIFVIERHRKKKMHKI